MTKEEALDRLMLLFWYNSSPDHGSPPGFEWSFIEGTTVGLEDKALNNFLNETYANLK